jgi:glycosyltransferase involved in cell wall biosynthesis
VKKLLLINYAMDEESSVFSHQAEAANEISNYFSEVFVLTSHVGQYPRKSNVHVMSTSWQRGRNLRNLFSFYRGFFHLLRTKDIEVIYCHMTDVQSALIAIPAKILQIPHFLWYAHAKKSFFLKFTSKFVSGLITSTAGSLPIQNSSVKIVGQAINPQKFIFSRRANNNFDKFVHFGRLDKSKRLAEIAQILKTERITNPRVSLTLFGDASGPESELYIEKILSESGNEAGHEWLYVLPSVPRNSIGELLEVFDVFIHAYLGSLDKTVLEATFVGIPVVTANPEYLSIFGSWNPLGFDSLENEILALRSFNQMEITGLLEARRKVADSNHGLSNWALQIAEILNG